MKLFNSKNYKTWHTKALCICKPKKGVYGLPQSLNIANDKLKQYLETFGYEPAPINPWLWRHQTHPLQFSLVVDYSGIQYENQSDINHLLYALKIIYNISEDWEGKLYCGTCLELKLGFSQPPTSLKNYNSAA